MWIYSLDSLCHKRTSFNSMKINLLANIKVVSVLCWIIKLYFVKKIFSCYFTEDKHCMLQIHRAFSKDLLSACSEISGHHTTQDLPWRESKGHMCEDKVMLVTTVTMAVKGIHLHWLLVANVKSVFKLSKLFFIIWEKIVSWISVHCHVYLYLMCIFFCYVLEYLSAMGSSVFIYAFQKINEKCRKLILGRRICFSVANGYKKSIIRTFFPGDTPIGTCRVMRLCDHRDDKIKKCS